MFKIKLKYVMIAVPLILILIINLNSFFKKNEFELLCDSRFIGRNIKEFNENSMKGSFGGKSVNSVKKDNNKIHLQSYVFFTAIIDNSLYCDVSYDETGKILNVVLSKYQAIPD